MEPKKSIINVSDFKNFEYSILMENTTAQTEILNSNKIRIIEFTQKGMRVQMPSNSCSTGHLLHLFIFPNISGKQLPRLPKDNEARGLIQITAKVASFEPGNKPEKALFTLEFLQYTENEWNSFTRKFQNLQKQVDQIFKVIKD